MNRSFTGWHMTAILGGFFSLVIAVNFIMARDAVATFGGTLAENGYVASQDYNHWIRAAAEQDRLGWGAQGSVEKGELLLQIRGPQNATAEVTLVHPLGQVADIQLTMRPIGSGAYRSEQSVPPGRWQARIVLRSGREQAKFLQEVRG